MIKGKLEAKITVNVEVTDGMRKSYKSRQLGMERSEEQCRINHA
jgi:hypothetical protein